MSFTVNASASNSGTATTVTVTISIASGHTVAVAVLDTNQSTIGTLTDSASHTYVTNATANDGSHIIATFHSLAINSAITSVSYTSTGTANTRFIAVWDLSGTGTITKADAKAVFFNFSAPNTTDGITTGAMTLTSSDGLIVGYAASFFSTSLVAGTGFTGDGSFVANGSLFEHKAVTGSAAATWTTSSNGDDVLAAGLAFQIAGAASAPFKPIDLDERVTTKVIASDFSPPNLLAQRTLKLPPFIQSELPGYAIRATGVYTDFAPFNLLTQQTLKLPPFTQENDGARTFVKGVYTDFSPPNLSFTLPVVVTPLIPKDLSVTVNARWVPDFITPNLLTGHLPLPPIAPVDASISIRAIGVFTDFSPPNLALSTLVPLAPTTPQDISGIRLEYRWVRGDTSFPNLSLSTLAVAAVTPLLPQDLSGSRIDARGLRTDFVPPNLTLILPVPPPPPLSTGAGRHGTRQQARRRRQLDVLRAKLEAFKEQRIEADQALMRAEEGEIKTRAKLLKRVRVKPLTKALEEYAPVKKAIAQRTVATQRHRSILEQILAHQLEADRIQREIEGEDEEAALHLFHFLMMETSWHE